MNPFSILTLKNLSERPIRNLLSVLSIGFGVALFTAIDIVNESTLNSFNSSIHALSGTASLSLMGGASGFSEDLVAGIETIPGVKQAIPVVESEAYYQDAKSSETLMVLGVDLLKESSVREYQSKGSEIMDDPLVFLNQPDSIILTHRFASDHHLKIGAPLRLSTAQGIRSFIIRGLLEPKGPAIAYGGNLVIMDIDGARDRFGKNGKVDRVDLVLDERFSIDSIRKTLEARYSDSLTVESPASQSETLRRLVEGYQALLSFVGLLALIVGLFLVINTATITLAERRKELGILRAIGATRGTLLRYSLEESLVLGLCGSMAGLLFGKTLAANLVLSMSHALSTQYLIPVQVTELTQSTALTLKALGLGTLTTVMGVFIATIQGLKIEPIEAARGIQKPSSTSGLLSPFIGFFFLTLIVIDAHFGLSQDYHWFRNLNPLFFILGAALASPFLVRILIKAVSLLIPIPSLRLSADNLIRNAKRTRSNLMTLMIGLMLVMILSVMNGSIKYSLNTWFKKTLAADLVVSSSGNILSFRVQPLHEKLINRLNTLDGLDISQGIGATGLRYLKQEYQGKTIAIKAFDPPHPRLRNALIDVKSGGEPSVVLDRLFSSDAPYVLVSENFTLHFKKKAGDWIKLQTPTGIQGFQIIGTMTEFTNPEGVLCLNRAALKRFWKDDLLSGVFLMAQNGISPDQLRKSLDRQFGKEWGLVATLNSDLIRDAQSMVDESFAYTRIIEWSALLVGLFGLFNTLTVSVIDRKKELGVLRAIGMSRVEVLFMILSESALQGMLGGIVAIGIAIFVCYFWVIGTLSSLMGWVLQFSVPWDSVWKTFFSGLIVGVLAGVLPAQRASRVPIRDALES